MKWDCHIHAVLDGENWRAALLRHRMAPDDGYLRNMLSRYRRAGFSYLRDGGDRWGVGLRARELAAQYGIEYRTPLAPLHRRGCYGGMIGESYESFGQFAALVQRQKALGCDFIKIMISGLMDFDHYGALTEPSLPAQEIGQLISIIHEQGLRVMAHANGAEAVTAAARAGVDSVEHGAYLDEQALAAMAESGTVWVPTVSAVGNLLGRGRFDDRALGRILDSLLENCDRFVAMGGRIAPGSDAGAWAVPHGGDTEAQWLHRALGDRADTLMARGAEQIRENFRPEQV